MAGVIIGLTARKQHGKSTCCEALTLAGFKEISCAEPLINVVKVLNIWDPTKMPYEEFKVTYFDKWGMYGRQILQKIGTDLLRNQFHKDIFVESLKDSMKGHRRVCIPDVRFENEAKVIREMGGYIVRIERPGHLTSDNHESEAGLDKYDWDYKITNNSTPEKLQDEILMFALSVVLQKGG